MLVLYGHVAIGPLKLRRSFEPRLISKAKLIVFNGVSIFQSGMSISSWQNRIGVLDILASSDTVVRLSATMRDDYQNPEHSMYHLHIWREYHLCGGFYDSSTACPCCSRSQLWCDKIAKCENRRPSHITIDVTGAACWVAV